MKVGFIVNPYAGGGVYRVDSKISEDENGAFGRLLSVVKTLLSGCEVMTSRGVTGEDLLRMAGVPTGKEMFLDEICEASAETSRAGVAHEGSIGRKRALQRSDSVNAAIVMARSGADVLVVVGGDGTMADAALGVVLSGRPAETCPILGIGVGTSNVGALISIRLKGLARPGKNAFRAQDGASKQGWLNGEGQIRSICHGGGFVRVPRRGLIAIADGEIVGVAFNDVVIGDTVLATVNGRKVDVRASSFMQRVIEPAIPSPVNGSDCEVALAKHDGSSITVARGTQVGQVVASILDGRFVGKAISGGACLGDLLDMPAAVAVIDRPIVRVSIDEAGLFKISPVTTRTASFEESDTVRVRGIRQGACVCCDGNPVLEVPENSQALIIEIRASRKLVYGLVVS